MYIPSDHFSHSVIEDFYIVTIIPLTLNTLNLLGSIYIFYRTYLRWRLDYDNFNSLSIKFPFYIAITDFLFSAIIIIDFSYTVSNVSVLETDEMLVWPSPCCEILGFFHIAFTLLNMLLVGSISFTTWLKVVRQYYFDWGKCDYKIWSPIGFLSFIIPIISINDIGAQRYWCGIKEGNSSLISTLLLITILFTLLTIIFCYMHVLKTFHDVKDDNSSSIINSEVNTEQRNSIEKKILAKVLTYILVFIFQYIPLMLTDIFKLMKIQYVLLNALSLSAISIGGISNFIQYIRNERFLLLPNKHNSDFSDNNNIHLEEREQTKSSS